MKITSVGIDLAKCSSLIKLDAPLSYVERLKRVRADVAVGAVLTDSIVVRFDVFKDDSSGLISGRDLFSVNGFDLERMEEALSTSIVEAVPVSAHAAP